MSELDHKWNTDDELEYLRWIGTTSSLARREHTRRDLLIGYINACDLRSDWGEINKDAVVREARAMLDKEAL